MVSDFESFADFDVIGKASFVFSLHLADNFEILEVELLLAFLVMLRDARVTPFFPLYGSAMLLPALFKGARCLTNIYGFFRTFARIFVNALAFLGVGVRFVFAAKYVFHLGLSSSA